ncbi:hypothetical protein Barb4_05525 [Bacteroidales bacterium Barb4]|nr:hypothetical protein Barb4_05525 [Bacteroidales bacterium Barb4]
MATFENVTSYKIDGTYDGADSEFYFEDQASYDSAIRQLDNRNLVYYTYPNWLCIMFIKPKLLLHYEVTLVSYSGIVLPPLEPIFKHPPFPVRDEESENIED